MHYERVLLLVALVVAPVQTGLRLSGADVEVPLATVLVLAAAIAALVDVCLGEGSRTSGVRITWPQLFLLLASGAGLVALVTSRAWVSVVKESTQVIETAFLVPWLAWRLVRREGMERLGDALAAVAFGVLLLALTGVAELWPLALSPAKSAILIIGGLPFLLLRGERLRPAFRLTAVLALGVAVGVVFRHGGQILAALLTLAAAGWLMRGPVRRVALLAGFAVLLGSGVQTATGANPWAQLEVHLAPGYVRRFYIECRAALLAPREFPLGGGLGRYRESINDLRLLQPLVPHPTDQKVPRDGNCQYLVSLVVAGVPAAVALLAMAIWAIQAASAAARATGDARTAALLAALVGWSVAGLFCVFVSRGCSVWFGALYGAAMAQCSPVRGSLTRRCVMPVAMVGGSLVLAVLCAHGVGYGQSMSHPVAGTLDRHLRVVTLPDDLDATGRIIKVEAETATAIVPPFVVVTDNQASGGKALAIPEGGGKGVGQGKLTITVKKAGEYILYARVRWDDGCGNSLRFVVGEDAAVLTDEVFSHWHMLEAPHPIRLAPGPQTVLLQNLEDGICLDWLAFRPAE